MHEILGYRCYYTKTFRAHARLRGPTVHLVAVDTAVGAVAIDSRTKFVATSNAVAATEDQADRAPPRPAGAVVVARLRSPSLIDSHF